MILLDVSEEMPSVPCLGPAHWPSSFDSCGNRGPFSPHSILSDNKLVTILVIVLQPVYSLRWGSVFYRKAASMTEF